MSPTMESLLAQAERKLGSRKAVLAAVGVSRQRFHSAMRGGPPLHIERLLRFAQVAGADPLETLRAGGRRRFADLLEEVARPRLGETTISERALLRQLDRLSAETRALIMHLVSGLVAEREGFVRRASMMRIHEQNVPPSAPAAESTDDGATQK